MNQKGGIFLTFQAACLVAVSQRIAGTTDKLRATSQHLTDSLEIRLKILRSIHYSDTTHQSLAILTFRLDANCATKLQLSEKTDKSF